MSHQKFFGKWQSTTLENFDAYMKALDVNMVLRKAGSMSTTYLDLSGEGDSWRWIYKIAFKSGDLKFKMGDDFEETTPDGRKCISHVTFENGKLVWLQRGKPCDTTITRHLEDDDNTMVEECVAKDVICIRKYKRQE